MDRSINPAKKSPSLSRVLPKSVRLASGLTLAAIVLAFSGCCTPFGPGCNTGNCYDCDGTNRPIPAGPFQGLKQQLTCGGGGCGEVYVGEWISTPPDCADPCCDDQFVGGAVPSQPFCWTLGELFHPRRFSGRFEGGRGDLGCDGCEAGCDDCGAGGYVDEGFAEQPYVEMAPSQNSGGCATRALGRVNDAHANSMRTAPSGQSTRYAQAPQANPNRTSSSSNSATPVRAAQRPTQAAAGTSRQTTQVARPATPGNGQRSAESAGNHLIRQASAVYPDSVYPDSAPARAAEYAPRTGANRNRIMN